MALTPQEITVLVVIGVLVCLWLCWMWRSRSSSSCRYYLTGTTATGLTGSGSASTSAANAPLGRVAPVRIDTSKGLAGVSHATPQRMSGASSSDIVGVGYADGIDSSIEEQENVGDAGTMLGTLPTGVGSAEPGSESLIVADENAGFYQSGIVPPSLNPDSHIRIDTAGAVFGLVRGEVDLPSREECMRICTDRNSQFQNARRHEQCDCVRLMQQQ
jgi:hypothetical protein